MGPCSGSLPTFPFHMSLWKEQYTCQTGKSTPPPPPPNAFLYISNNSSPPQAGFADPIQGYLTLQQEVTGLILKWIPNSLLKDASNASRYSALSFNLLSWHYLIPLRESKANLVLSVTAILSQASSFTRGELKAARGEKEREK